MPAMLPLVLAMTLATATAPARVPTPAPGTIPPLVAHRGESFDAPENTLAAIELAWERGADEVEIDVHITADGQPVVLHDADTKRTCGVHLVVARTTLAALRRLDAGRFKGERWAGQRIPTLAEVLATLPNQPGTRVWIEIKCGLAAVEPVAAAIEASGKRPDQALVMSFDLETCRAAKRRLADAGVKVYYLSDFRKNPATKKWSPTVRELIARARDAGLDGIDVAARQPVTPAFVRAVKQAGLGVGVWTVDDLRRARRLAAAGVDAITTNRPAWMRERWGGR